MTEKTRLGVYFGTFAPFHKGHQQQIYKCAALNDQVLLVVSGYTHDRGDKIGLPLPYVITIYRKLLLMKRTLRLQC